MSYRGILTILCIVLPFQLSNIAEADTTNRAQQFSPVPGIFVGGVGLLCQEIGINSSEGQQIFLLFTRDRTQAGMASFDNIDVNYDRFEISPSLNSYKLMSDKQEIRIDRQDLILRTGAIGTETKDEFTCQIKTVDTLHNAAKRYLRSLLSKNKI